MTDPTDSATSYRLLLEQIADTTADVRAKQKRYFKTHNLHDLSDCKLAEKKLDQLIAQRALILAERGQYRSRT